MSQSEISDAEVIGVAKVFRRGAIIYQSLRIDQLEHDNTELTIQLHDAETEVGSLQLEITKLEDGQVALTVKVQDAKNEMGRLSMVMGVSNIGSAEHA